MTERIDTRTMADLALEAMQVQDACNMSGVVHGFSRSISRLRQLLDASGNGGTQAVNMHPICILWVGKLHDLTAGECTALGWSRAYDAVSKLASEHA